MIDDHHALDRARDPTDEEWVKILKDRSLLKGFDAGVFSGNKIGHATLAGKSYDFLILFRIAKRG